MIKKSYKNFVNQITTSFIVFRFYCFYFLCSSYIYNNFSAKIHFFNIQTTIAKKIKYFFLTHNK